MVVEYTLLLVVMAILLVGRIVGDRMQIKQRWLCFYEQRRMVFPRPQVIKNWQDLPAQYKEVFSAQENMPYTLYLPGSTSIFFPRKDTLIVLYQNKLVLYEGNGASGTEIAFDQIQRVDHGKMIFSFWLNIFCNGQRYTIPYNASGDRCFAPILPSLRLRSYQEEKHDVTQDDYLERKKLHWLSTMHYKFLYASQKSLLPGQRIVDVLFQPSYTLKKNMSIPFLSNTTIYNPHLCILTEKELILLQERNPTRTATYDQYSVRRIFIPCHKIRNVELREDGNHEMVTLTLSLRDSTSLPLSFTKENEKAGAFVKALQERLSETYT